MEEISDRLAAAIEQMHSIADDITPQDAAKTVDDATLQVFWRDWTAISQWAGALWRQLSEDLEAPATPVTDEDLDEVGGSG